MHAYIHSTYVHTYIHTARLNENMWAGGTWSLFYLTNVVCHLQAVCRVGQVEYGKESFKKWQKVCVRGNSDPVYMYLYPARNPHNLNWVYWYSGYTAGLRLGSVSFINWTVLLFVFISSVVSVNLLTVPLNRAWPSPPPHIIPVHHTWSYTSSRKYRLQSIRYL